MIPLPSTLDAAREEILALREMRLSLLERLREAREDQHAAEQRAHRAERTSEELVREMQLEGLLPASAAEGVVVLLPGAREWRVVQGGLA